MRVVISSIVILTLLALVFPTSFASSHTDFPDREYFDSWSTPVDFRGDIVIRFTVDLGPVNQCTSFVGAGSNDPDGGVRYQMKGAHFGITGWSGRAAQVHHEDLDTRTLMTGGGSGMRMTSTGPLSGTHEVSMAVFDAYALRTDTDDPWMPLEWALGCDEPFVVSDKAGSREALGFTHQNLDGTGASAVAWLVGASVNIDGGIGATFEAAEVRFDWLSYGNLDGTLVLEAPLETTAWDLTTTSRASSMGGPGAYVVSLDRIAAGTFDDLVGIMTGSSPVASFDDVL